MQQQWILSVDQSTSGTKVMLVDRQGVAHGKASAPHRQFYPENAWVEHDPEEIMANVRRLMKDVVDVQGVVAEEIAAVAITNQRETVLVWDKNTGKPVYPAIVWQCRRTADMCEALRASGAGAMVAEKTGLVIDPYFSATKIAWILDHVPGARHRAEAGELLAGTMDSWLVWNLSGRKAHVTDPSNASRTLLFNIHTGRWDEALAGLFRVPLAMLPALTGSDAVAAETVAGDLFPVALPLAGIIGDSQGALFGQNCFEPGMVKATLGTGTSLMMQVGSHCPDTRDGLVASVAWEADGRLAYVLEGIIHSTGDAIQWVRDNLGLFSDYESLERDVAALESNRGVYLVPAFVGLGIPHWDAGARASVSGLSRGSGRAEICRAALEAVAYQIHDALEAMAGAAGKKPEELRVDGGLTANAFVMQFMADILQTPVVCAATAELSAMGSVYLAGLASGFWKSREEILALRKGARVFRPSMDATTRQKNLEGWHAAVRRVLTNNGAL